MPSNDWKTKVEEATTWSRRGRPGSLEQAEQCHMVAFGLRTLAAMHRTVRMGTPQEIADEMYASADAEGELATELQAAADDFFRGDWTYSTAQELIFTLAEELGVRRDRVNWSCRFDSSCYLRGVLEARAKAIIKGIATRPVDTLVALAEALGIRAIIPDPPLPKWE